jgi:hypothetical protein
MLSTHLSAFISVASVVARGHGVDVAKLRAELESEATSNHVRSAQYINRYPQSDFSTQKLLTGIRH